MGKQKIKVGDLVLFQDNIGWITKIVDDFSYWVEYMDGSKTWYAPDTIKYLRGCLLKHKSRTHR